MLFFVKARIDMTRFAELGRRLADGSLDRTGLLSTHCYQFDPEVGLMLWEAADAAELRHRMGPLRGFYSDVMEIAPVVSSAEAAALLASA